MSSVSPRFPPCAEAKGLAPEYLSQKQWLFPKYLTSALTLAFLFILYLDASVITNFHGISIKSSGKDPSLYHLQTKYKNYEYSSWISNPIRPNYTSSLISQWLAQPQPHCKEDSLTFTVSVPELDKYIHGSNRSTVVLSTGRVHTFVISALDESGKEKCTGGDYFETDLSGTFWKSRPPVTDHGNGTYSFRLQVHPHFSGNYNFTLVLLFRSFQGLRFSPVRFKFRKELRNVPIQFYNPQKPAPVMPDLKICRSNDFKSAERMFWSGRWTRLAQNDQCEIDNDGRYRCLDRNFPCKQPWCDGPLGALESNGWVYSAHCSFKLFTADSAWTCLNNKWLFFWGDSNHVDTLRNLLTFVLDAESSSVTRRFDKRFHNPKNKSESVRITNVFNGHWNETKNYLGLQSLQSEYFRSLIWRYFLEEKTPDVMVLNSGLHDGIYYKSIRAFAKGADYAAKFWVDVMNDVRRRGMGVPRVFYRTTIATGGYARDLGYNPSKMEAFNGVMLDKLTEKGVLTGGVVDEFDMTFPWHYDNRCNDGVHYGRAPAKAKWRDGEVGHQYFVDLMLAHVLLNAVCNIG